ncbi:MAG: hypothetical protein DHS20C11_09640 [Lysobacteraceae bacterium]|nr:MAG: hypothetical protein DHS20C11_09640 [Xanthomonadaceae bacterium]
MLTAAALLAFAANSWLCRWALRDASIDAASFSLIRVMAGAAVLLWVVRLRKGQAVVAGQLSWQPALSLAAYMVLFAFAYTELDTGPGALLLFGTVQATMIAIAVWRGERGSLPQWLGWGLVAIGFLVLLLPGATAPMLGPALLMMGAGVAWGLYTLAGQGQSDPLAMTELHFRRALLPVGGVTILAWPMLDISINGAALAIVSGALTSGLGYVCWYAALRHLKSLQAAMAQLTVPVIAAYLGVLHLDEPLHTRLQLASVLMLGGIAVTVWAGRRLREG